MSDYYPPGLRTLPDDKIYTCDTCGARNYHDDYYECPVCGEVNACDKCDTCNSCGTEIDKCECGAYKPVTEEYCESCDMWCEEGE
jgi:hypothetical protein